MDKTRLLNHADELKIYKMVERLDSKWAEYCEALEDIREFLSKIVIPDQEKWLKEITIDIRVFGYNKNEELREIIEENSFQIGRDLTLDTKKVDDAVKYIRKLKKNICNKKPNPTVLKIISRGK